ncbi:MAG: 50S ribosomal protein L11 methyltransferase [Flavobacteriales bacterium]
MIDYTKVSVRLEPLFPLQDILPQELGDIGFETFEENPAGFDGYIRGDLFDEHKLQSVLTAFNEAGKISYTLSFIKGENWNSVWEKSFEPVIEPGKFAICASFHTPPGNVPIVIWVEPRMAFGTGHHPTTRLMASHLIDYDCTNLSVLDMGCGTGILSIIAEKKGASEVLAIDNEEPAVENTKANLRLNSCSKISVEKGSAECLNNRRFHIILANINRNVLWEHMPVYANALSKGGQLWLSGFYSSDVAPLSERISSCGLKLLNVVEMQDWQLVKCEKA